MKQHNDPALVGSFLVIALAFVVITAVAVLAGAAESDRCLGRGGQIVRTSSGTPACTVQK